MTGDKKHMPFNLFIQSQRRQMILDNMMSKDEVKRQKGNRISENYKMQLAEKKARFDIDQKLSARVVSAQMKDEKN